MFFFAHKKINGRAGYADDPLLNIRCILLFGMLSRNYVVVSRQLFFSAVVPLKKKSMAVCQFFVYGFDEKADPVPIPE
jgi:hypothetical protein